MWVEIEAHDVLLGGENCRVDSISDIAKVHDDIASCEFNLLGYKQIDRAVRDCLHLQL